MQYTIDVLSPVHVGTGETLTPLEFIAGERFAVFDTYTFFTARPERAEEFTARLSGTPASQIGTLRLDGLLRGEEAANRDYWAYSAWLTGPVKAALGKDRRGDIRCAIKTPDGRPYIPATSIKGAIRTALAYYEYKEHGDLLQRLIEQRVRDEKDRHQSLQQQIFLAVQGEEATHDYLRALSIADPEPVAAEDSLMVAWGKVLSAPIDLNGHRMPNRPSEFKHYNLFSEAIKPGISLSGRLAFQQKLLSSPEAAKEMKWKEHQAALSVEQICRAVNTFAGDICEWERCYFRQIDEFGCGAIAGFYESLLAYVEEAKKRSDTLLLSIGQGSGWHKMTVGLLLEKSMPKDQFDRIRTGLARQRLEYQYPKSRKLVMRGEGAVWAPFGWIALRLPGAPPAPKLVDTEELMKEQKEPQPSGAPSGFPRREEGRFRPSPRPPGPPVRPEPPPSMPKPLPQARPAPQGKVKKGERVPAEVLSNEGGVVRVRLLGASGEELSFRAYYPHQAGAKVKIKVMKVDAAGKVTEVVPG